MSIKKIISVFLTICICSTLLTIDTFANCLMSVNGEVPYAGKAVDINNWVNVTIPKFNGTPLASPDRAVFYSSKGEFKLNITDENRSYFENGGSVIVSLTPSKAKFNLNPLNWSRFLSYKPVDNKNKLDIVVSRKTLLPYDIKSILRKLQSIPFWVRYGAVPILSFLARTFGFLPTFGEDPVTNILMWCPFILITAADYAIEYMPKIFAPVFNLIENVNPSDEISFKYGVVLTSPDDEIGLNDNLPKVGDVNLKAATELKRQKAEDKKLKDITDNSSLQGTPDYIFTANLANVRSANAAKYSKYDVDELTKARNAKRPGALNKLKTTVPIREGIICKLDAKHPTQTFRYVINDTLDPNTTGLFSIMLANPTKTGTDVDNSSVIFDAYYSYDISSMGNSISERMKNDPSLSEKVKFLTDTGASDRWFTDFTSSITKWFTIAGQQSVQPAQPTQQLLPTTNLPPAQPTQQQPPQQQLPQPAQPPQQLPQQPQQPAAPAQQPAASAAVNVPVGTTLTLTSTNNNP